MLLWVLKNGMVEKCELYPDFNTILGTCKKYILQKDFHTTHNNFHIFQKIVQENGCVPESYWKQIVDEK